MRVAEQPALHFADRGRNVHRRVQGFQLRHEGLTNLILAAVVRREGFDYRRLIAGRSGCSDMIFNYGLIWSWSGLVW